jgi:hypothetical protein
MDMYAAHTTQPDIYKKDNLYPANTRATIIRAI